MGTIVYLDADDEITSAAARIRASPDERIGLVIPFGSRVATSRINFRLLAREAQANGRRLDVVAPDASARALASAAGLAVYASVGEYEAALDRDERDAGDDRDERGADGPAVTPAGVGGVATPGPGAARPLGAASIDPSRDTAPTQRVRVPLTEPASTDYGAPGVDRLGRDRGRASEPRVVKPPRRRVPVGAIVVGVALLLVVGGGAFAVLTFLPSARITVTPRLEPVGPLAFTVRADPGATAVDPAAGVIPATTVELPVSAEGEFDATGKRVVETPATGGVRWTNCDPTAAYRIPKGTVVRTDPGVGFATDEEVFLPVAVIKGPFTRPTLDCSSSEVSVTAVKPGTAGNVAAGAIRVVPAKYNRTVLRVTNPAATAGGTREEFPKVVQADVDAALASLGEQARAAFETALDDPANVPAGTTVFPETAVLGDVTPDTDPATLVGTEAATFRLAVSATGSVQAADATPVTAIAEDRLRAAVTGGWRLVDGTTRIEVGEGTVEAGAITFAVTARARQLRPLDALALERLVLGRSRADAEAALSPYGEVEIALDPGWVTSVPSMEGRVTLTVAEPAPPGDGSTGPGTTSPSPGLPSPLEDPGDGSPAGSAPGDGGSGEPVPSG